MLTIDLNLLITNVGHSVASNIRIYNELIFEVGIDPYAEERQQRVCEDKNNLVPTKEFVLFPGGNSGGRLFDQVGSFNVIRDEDILPAASGTPYIDPTIVGCVLYDIPGAINNPHHTGFSYQFRKKLPGGRVDNRAFPVGEPVAVNVLVAVDNYLGVNFIN